jgi:3-hydroxyisobutyrate dehydrogenase
MAKLCNQVIVGLTLLATAEGLALAATSGLDPAKVLDAVGSGAGASWTLEKLGPKMLAGDWRPGFMVRHLRKDLRMAIEMADALDQPVLGTALLRELLNAAEAAGHGGDGSQALYCFLRRIAQPEGAGTDAAAAR